MPLPSSIQTLFSTTYNGVPAARLKSALEAHNLEAMLRDAGHSYQTKISKSKKTGREFVVMLLTSEAEVEPAHAA
jgi:hypothetical protein